MIRTFLVSVGLMVMFLVSTTSTEAGEPAPKPKVLKPKGPPTCAIEQDQVYRLDKDGKRHLCGKEKDGWACIKGYVGGECFQYQKQ